MKKFTNLHLQILLFIFLSFLSTGCKNSNPNLQRKFKYNTNYYLGLKNIEKNEIDEAKKHFNLCVKKGSGYCARYSELELIKLENQRTRIAMWENFVQKYNDEDAILSCAKDLSSIGEDSKIIALTEKIDIENAKNELVFLRLKAMKNKNDSRFQNELYRWFTERSISQEHSRFFREERNIFIEKTVSENDEKPESENDSFDFPRKVINLRMSVYNRDYLNAFSKAEEVFSVSKEANLPPQIYSDLGKTFYYGSNDNFKNASRFDSEIENCNDKEILFYLYFYSARLYEKDGRFPTRAENRYKSAMENATTDEKSDNALWYFLRSRLKRNTDNGVNAVIENCVLWNDKNYFDDLLDLISNLLLTEGKWNDFYKVYKAIDGNASDYMTSRFAYIYARLLEENLASIPENSENDKNFFINEAFRRALKSGTDYYYRLLSIAHLNLSEKETESVLCKTALYDEKYKIDSEAEILLSGYAAFGFPERIYPEFVKLTGNDSKLSMDSMLSLSSFLKDCGENKNEYYPQSLRIASRAINGSERNISKSELKLFFPKDYKTLIEERCVRYKIPEEIMYALVRSESFFDAEIKSSAGAIGLTQLMIPTANDVARKLKVQDFDLTNPETNLEFGSFYIAELSSRLDGKWISALLSYNTGISRIRRWLTQQKNLPMDLFLEIAPYAETREYGRKLLSASCMYAWLYKNESIKNTVSFLMD